MINYILLPLFYYRTWSFLRSHPLVTSKEWGDTPTIGCVPPQMFDSGHAHLGCDSWEDFVLSRHGGPVWSSRRWGKDPWIKTDPQWARGHVEGRGVKKPGISLKSTLLLMLNGLHLYSTFLNNGHSKCFTIFLKIHPFMHSSGAVRGEASCWGTPRH